jgi:dihydrofolate synthase / folylpolyglutamate synthase
MRFKLLQDWLSWLESCHPSSEVELGLGRTAQVAERLAIAPTLAGKHVVTVAGTNGKGSCVAALNALLRHQGLHVGCFTSPHFLHYNERIVINDQPVLDAELVAAFERVDQAREQVELTYFEFGTLVALDIFCRSALDVIILEVGLGGRLDSVNIIDPDIAIVTSIDIDHQDWLGSDRESIGREKAGIFRPGKPAICADPNPPAAIAAVADELNAVLFQRGRDFAISSIDQQAQALAGVRWQGVSASGETKEMILPKLTLPLGSVAAALQAMELLKLPAPEAGGHCLAQVQLPGRFQYVENTAKDDQGQLILDVAHNPAAAQLLAQRLKSAPIAGRTIALIALMKDKDCYGVIEALKPCVDAWFVADLKDSPRAMPASELATVISEHEITMISVSKNVRQAYRRARSLMVAQDRLVVLGSFITVSEVMKILQRDSALGGHP